MSNSSASVKILSYQNCIDTLSQKVYRRGINYSLDALKSASKDLNSPEKHLSPVVHVAGTNGKGSTIAFLRQILQNSGYTVGSFTSPHLYSYQERIAINNVSISEDEFSRYFTMIKKGSPLYDSLSEFEVLTLMSFLYFKDKKPDIILYETGLGGRLDTTNLVHPNLCIITQIDKDHENILGNTLEKIASDKAGIIKNKVPVISISSQKKEVIDIFKFYCDSNNAPLTITRPLETLPKDMFLKGSFQKTNAALALKAAHILKKSFPKITEKSCEQGLKQTTIKGRYNIHQLKTQTIVIDGAHNPAAIKNLIASLKTDFPKQKPCFIVGFSKDKNSQEMMTLLQGYSNTIYYCEFDKHLAKPHSTIEKEFKQTLPTVTLTNALPYHPLLVFTGSLYFIAQLKNVTDAFK
ncbi:hypothetical protein DID77_01290 [Candidatus Marinamargulisbacteria bacterium SCGC AG-439-L15]|nr:hypothetical protein DID77_01290 [Candidatus Marinamargulisbacteria bacterium SCGC AG-439-L15]